MKIHERAIVHPSAQIGEGTVVGPDAIIDEHVRVGQDCEIRARAILTGHTTIGDSNQIGYNAIIGAEPQDLSFEGGVSFVEIGNENVIRENTTIHRGTKPETSTVIGNKNYLMAGVHVAHNCHIGNEVTLVNNVLLAGYVEIRDFAFLSGDVVVHQFVRIGEYVMVRGQTRVGMDVPPYAMAAFTNAVVGLNRVGLKRKGFGPDRRKTILNAFRRYYQEGKNRSQALEAIRSDESLQTEDVELFIEFLEKTKRGVCHYYENEAPPAEG
ncbi:MAG: acyl-ACP--UDP-N-acetylglucosamine O-acyltransferase [Verrucomicrobiota bacterium]